MKISISQEHLGTLCICALRYCHGRQTYMPELVQRICSGVLSKLSDKDVSVLADDCDFQEKFHLYGDPTIDKPGWLKWREAVLEEKNKRESVTGEKPDGNPHNHKHLRNLESVKPH